MFPTIALFFICAMSPATIILWLPVAVTKMSAVLITD